MGGERDGASRLVLPILKRGNDKAIRVAQQGGRALAGEEGRLISTIASSIRFAFSFSHSDVIRLFLTIFLFYLFFFLSSPTRFRACTFSSAGGRLLPKYRFFLSTNLIHELRPVYVSLPHQHQTTTPLFSIAFALTAKPLQITGSESKLYRMHRPSAINRYRAASFYYLKSCSPNFGRR